MIQTPCVGVCKIHEVYKVCLGCKRTRLDILNWHSSDDKEKLKIIARAEQKAVIFGDLVNAGQ